MSVESAKAFLKKYASEPDFKKKIEETASDEERQKIVKEAGFYFTKDEIKEISSESGELSDADLEKVAGGSPSSWLAVGVGGASAVAAAF